MKRERKKGVTREEKNDRKEEEGKMTRRNTRREIMGERIMVWEFMW